jgi:hypothetical protein
LANAPVISAGVMIANISWCPLGLRAGAGHQRIVVTPIEAKLWTMMVSVFVRPTSPP